MASRELWTMFSICENEDEAQKSDYQVLRSLGFIDRQLQLEDFKQGSDRISSAP